jgi:hypothetical protein
MAFPQLAATAAAADTSNKLTRDFTLPTGIFAGQLLIAFIVMDDQADTGDITITTPGWLLLKDSQDFGGFAGPATAKCTVAYKIAVGSETTMTVTSTNSETCAFVCLRITDYDAGTPPQIVFDAFGGAASDPVSLTPSWGAEDTLWITGIATNPGWSFATAAPTGYSNLTEAHWNQDDGVGMAIATRERNAASEDPDAFGWSAAGQVARITMAVRTGSDGPGPLPFELRLSGGASNADPTLSIGGAQSSVEVGTDLFDDVTYADTQAGFTDYRLIYVHNSDTGIAGNVLAYVSSQLETGRTMSLGVATEASGVTVTAVANDSTAPAGVTFSAPTSIGTAVDVGPVAPGQAKGLWLRRSVVAATASDPVNPWAVALEVEAL